MLKKKCLFCGKEFEKVPSVSMYSWSNEVKFCSRECYAESKKIPKEKTCSFCKKKFEYSHWNKRSKYCSPDCASKAQRKPLALCEACGKEVKEHGRRFCSRECKVEWYKGEEVYNYLGGQAREHYASSFWLELAEKIRERDGHRCRRCNCLPRKGRKHDVHHVEPYRVSQNDNEENLITLCKKCHKIVENMTWKELGI